MANVSGIENILQAILSIGNAEQNFAYAPYVYEQHYNIVTSFLISELVRQYPNNPQVLDMLEPYVMVDKVPVKDGYLQLPDSYRNILGAPYFNFSAKGNPCGDNTQTQPLPLNANTFKTANLKAGCNVVPLKIVPESEFAYLTTSSYNKPTWKEPIGYRESKFKIKVCPYDLPTATVLFVIQEQAAVYRYITQPDDTYIFDAANSVDGLWTPAAFAPIFNGVFALYSAYSRDNQLTDFSKLLTQAGIL